MDSIKRNVVAPFVRLMLMGRISKTANTPENSLIHIYLQLASEDITKNRAFL